jgi:hypothetical protein
LFENAILRNGIRRLDTFDFAQCRLVSPYQEEQPPD